jgi:hypothetical protein
MSFLKRRYRSYASVRARADKVFKRKRDAAIRLRDLKIARANESYKMEVNQLKSHYRVSENVARRKLLRLRA